MFLSGGEQSSQKAFLAAVFSSGTAVTISVGLVLRPRNLLLRSLTGSYSLQSCAALGTGNPILFHFVPTRGAKKTPVNFGTAVRTESEIILKVLLAVWAIH